MKKKIYLSGVLLMAAAVLVSCKKERTCQCTTTVTQSQPESNGNPGIVHTESFTHKTETEKMTKKKALSAVCASYESSGNTSMTSTTTYSGGISTDTETYSTTQKRDCKLD